MANPNGRPPKEKCFANMLRIAINEAVSKDDARPRLRAVAEMLVKKGMEGDIAAIKEIADRLDGKVPQGIEGPGDDGEHIIKVAWLPTIE